MYAYNTNDYIGAKILIIAERDGYSSNGSNVLLTRHIQQYIITDNFDSNSSNNSIYVDYSDGLNSYAPSTNDQILNILNNNTDVTYDSTNNQVQIKLQFKQITTSDNTIGIRYKIRCTKIPKF